MQRTFTQHISAMTLVLSLVGLLGLVACDSGQSEPDAPAPAEGEYGAIEGSTPAVEPAEVAPVEIPRDGSISPERFPQDLPHGLTAEVPKNFPSSIPLYPGAQPAQGKGVDRGDGTGMGGVQFVSNDRTSDIYAYYDDRLKSEGWTVKETRNDGNVGSFSVERDCGNAEIFMMDSPMGGTDMFFVFEGDC